MLTLLRSLLPWRLQSAGSKGTPTAEALCVPPGAPGSAPAQPASPAQC